LQYRTTPLNGPKKNLKWTYDLFFASK
jgi:hypothetical protein